MDTLNYIKEIEGPGDRRSWMNSERLLKYFITKKFVLTTISYEIMFRILENTSKLLQNPGFNLIYVFNYDRK